VSLRRLHTGGRVLGDREVSHFLIVGGRRDMRAARVDACLQKKGALGGNMVAPKGAQRQRSDRVEVSK
jgi:hypothetical protein